MTVYIRVYLTALVVFFIVDILWIGLFANAFYRERLGFLLSDSPNFFAALIFYLLFVTGLVVLVVLPGMKTKNFFNTLIKAAVYGLSTYGTYDLTNYALVQGWPLSVTIVDMVWGMMVSVVVCLASIKLSP